MVKPYKVGDSVICDNLISIETCDKSKPNTPQQPSSSVSLAADQGDSTNMTNETATEAPPAPVVAAATTTNATPGKECDSILAYSTLIT